MPFFPSSPNLFQHALPCSTVAATRLSAPQLPEDTSESMHGSQCLGAKHESPESQSGRSSTWAVCTPPVPSTTLSSAQCMLTMNELVNTGTDTTGWAVYDAAPRWPPSSSAPTNSTRPSRCVVLPPWTATEPNLNVKSLVDAPSHSDADTSSFIHMHGLHALPGSIVSSCSDKRPCSMPFRLSWGEASLKTSTELPDASTTVLQCSSRSSADYIKKSNWRQHSRVTSDTACVSL